MLALQRHFRCGGRTNQFALFSRLVYLQLDLRETDILTHMATIDSIVSELELTGFTWSSDSIKGLFYQLRMPAEMTKEINKDLDGIFDDTRPTFNIKDIKDSIQIHLTREKTASDTIHINSLASSVEALAIKTPQRFRQTNLTTMTPQSRSQDQRTTWSSPLSARRTAVDTELQARWRRGPPALTGSKNERSTSKARPIKVPISAHPNVHGGVIQCFYCGRFGHSYRDDGFKACSTFANKQDRTGAHYNDWRQTENGLFYSIDVLYPNQKRSSNPNVSALETSDSDVKVSAMSMNSEGINVSDNGSDIPGEYLFDGGATDSVSNKIHLLTGYRPLPRPIPVHTATNDSRAVIIGKGKLPIVTEDDEKCEIEDVYYCPTATTTIISPGALLAKGATMSLDEKNDYRIRLKSGKFIRAFHKNWRWFVESRRDKYTCKSATFSMCAIKNTAHTSRLWHNRFGHVSMRWIQTLFKKSDEYGLPRITPDCIVPCEDCLKCKITRSRVLGPTNREPKMLDVIVLDVAGPFNPCLTGERFMVTF